MGKRKRIRISSVGSAPSRTALAARFPLSIAVGTPPWKGWKGLVAAYTTLDGCKESVPWVDYLESHLNPRTSSSRSTRSATWSSKVSGVATSIHPNGILHSGIKCSISRTRAWPRRFYIPDTQELFFLQGSKSYKVRVLSLGSDEITDPSWGAKNLSSLPKDLLLIPGSQKPQSQFPLHSSEDPLFPEILVPSINHPIRLFKHGKINFVWV